MWKEVEDRKADKTRMEEAAREGRKERNEEIAIARIVAEKEDELDEKKNWVDLRATEEMVLRQFHKYLKVFEKKESEKILTRKA